MYGEANSMEIKNTAKRKPLRIDYKCIKEKTKKKKVERKRHLAKEMHLQLGHLLTIYLS